jgi:outer membrane protein assembly factor BamB
MIRLALVFGAIAATPAGNPSDWPTYHRDPARSGYVPDAADPGTLAIAWSTALDGAVQAEPLVVNGQVIVATENDSIYALDAQSGAVTWHTRVGDPVPLRSLPCGNIDPLGITGTPVYDPATGLVFAVAEVEGPGHVLVGLDVRTGEVRVRRGLDVPGMTPATHQQRGALALSGGRVYVVFGGLYGDCGDYRGRVVAATTDGNGPLLSWAVPTRREGGIWAPPGPAIDAGGRLYVSVGNGAAEKGAWDHSDSVLRLSPSLELQDGFAPERWTRDNASDADLGSLGPVLLPDNRVFVAGKAGIGYLLRADALGGVGGELWQGPVCHAYGGAAVAGSTVYLPCTEGLQQLRVGTSVTRGWRADGLTGSPVVGGHTVYALDHDGTLHALDADTGRPRATIRVGRTARFATPTLAGDLVLVGTLTGITAVRGA